MKEKPTGKSLVEKGTDWKRVRSLSDRQIRRAIQSERDAQPTDAEFWKKAHVVIPAAKPRSPSAWMQIFSNGCVSKRATRHVSTLCSEATWMPVWHLEVSRLTRDT